MQTNLPSLIQTRLKVNSVLDHEPIRTLGPTLGRTLGRTLVRNLGRTLIGLLNP